MLGISTKTLKEYGEVSEQIAREMARGVVTKSGAQVSVSITGIAGPGGGTTKKPVGMVCFAWEMKDNHMRSETRHFSGDREAVRQQSVAVAMQGLITLLRDTDYSVA
jgi:nicotinamide-nucleotide amidase